MNAMWIQCEGSNLPLAGGRICSMCGAPFTDWDGNAPKHERTDILAMVERGDFDESVRRAR